MCLTSNQNDLLSKFCLELNMVSDKLNDKEIINNDVISELYSTTSEFYSLCQKLDVMFEDIKTSEDKNELIDVFNKYIEFKIDFFGYGCYQSKLNTKTQLLHEIYYIYDGVNININVNNFIKDVMLTFGTTKI